MATKSTGWSCKVSVSTSSNSDESVKITAKAVWVNSGWRYNMGPIKAYVTINGSEYEVYSGNTKGKIITDNNSETELGSKTITITKTHSSHTIKCSAKLVSSSTYVSGTKTSGTESVSVSAKTSYTYKYNANGGSGAPGSQTKWHEEELRLSSTKPTRTGYTFNTWKDNEGKTRDPGSLAGRNANLTMTAQWTENTYTIKYNANGGSGAPGNQTKKYTTNLTLSSTKPTRTGYSFQGWATSASGSVAYSAGGTFKTNANTTLYAVWKANTYTVSFNANGGSGAPGNQTATHDINLTLSNTKPTRTGYTFKGWSTSSSGSVTHNPGGAYKFTANTPLYAVWQINTYTVSFNGNGATSGNTAAQTKNYNTTFALPANGFVKTNYNFKGWATSAGGSVVYNDKANFTVTSNVILYAVWELAYVKPILSNYTARRCDTASQISQTGDCLRIDFKWSVFKPIGHEDQYANPTLRTYWMIQGTSNWNYVDTQLSGTGGTTSLKLADGQINVNNSYRIYSVITDNTGNSTNSQFETIQSAAFPIDVKVGETGIAFGKVAEADGYADFQFIPRFYLDRGDGTHVSPQYIVNGLARTPLEILPNDSDIYGDGLRLGVGGIFIAGSGESSNNLWNAIKSSTSPGDETTYITSDSDLYLASNLNGDISDGKIIKFAKNGTLHPDVAGTCNLGSSGWHWGNIYASNYYSSNAAGIYLDQYGNIHTQKTMTSGHWYVENGSNQPLKIEFSDDSIRTRGVYPQATSTYICGSNTYRWQCVYTDFLNIASGAGGIFDATNNTCLFGQRVGTNGVVVNAANNGILYLGYWNTTGINILNGKINFTTSKLDVYTNTDFSGWLNVQNNIRSYSGDIWTDSGSVRCNTADGSGKGCRMNGSNGNLTVCGSVYCDYGSMRFKHIYDADKVTNASNMYITSNGWIRRTTNTSLLAHKKDIKNIENEELNPEKLYDLEVKQFKYKDDYQPSEYDIRYGKDLIGFIAEDVEKIYPIAVDYEYDIDHNDDENINDYEKDTIKTVQCTLINWNERYLIPPMLKLIQNHKIELDKNKKIIELQNIKIAQLEEQLKKILEKIGE